MLSLIVNFVFGWGGVSFLIAALALAAAWLLPLYKREALIVAAVAASFTFTYGKGYRDGYRVIQAQWDAAKVAAIERGEGARRDAVRDVGNGDVRPGGLSDDKFNRD